jgi:chromatin segregation and condensation protein Rec8/ScpA/Scc1 (kleisin family)
MCLVLVLSSCGGVDSKIEGYRDALKDKDLDKAASILVELKSETLSDDQKAEIKGIHEEYFSDAVDEYIDQFEKLMEEKEVEKAVKMLQDVPESMFTDKQKVRIAEISMKFGKSAMSAAGDMMQEAMGTVDQAVDQFKDMSEDMENMFN